MKKRWLLMLVFALLMVFLPTSGTVKAADYASEFGGVPYRWEDDGKTLIIGEEGKEYAYDDYKYYTTGMMWPWAQDWQSSRVRTVKVEGIVHGTGSHKGMFENFSAVTEFDLAGFRTENVTNMESMFNRCKAVQKLDLSSFDTSNVTTMQCMFLRCDALKEVDVSSFNTSKVTNMTEMFSNCGRLKKLDLSSFTTESLEEMYSMFFENTDLEELNISGFDTTHVDEVDFWDFQGSESLQIMVLGPKTFLNPDTLRFEGSLTRYKTLNGKKANGPSYAKLGDYNGTAPGWYKVEQKTVKYPTTGYDSMKVGTVLTVGKASYKVTSKKCVQYLAPVASTVHLRVPDYVVIEGRKYYVTSIGAEAFKNDQKLSTMTVGKYVKTIGKYAFYNCPHLNHVWMDENESLTKIYGGAFKNSSLDEIILPASVKYVGKQAFYGCDELHKITVRTTALTAKNVGDNAFGIKYEYAHIEVPEAKLKAYTTLFAKKGFTGENQVVELED